MVEPPAAAGIGKVQKLLEGPGPYLRPAGVSKQVETCRCPRRGPSQQRETLTVQKLAEGTEEIVVAEIETQMPQSRMPAPFNLHAPDTRGISS